MFENLRRGRQARNFTTNVPKIVFRTDIFRKLSLGAPVVVVVVFNALWNENFTRGKFGWLPILCVSCLWRNFLQIWDFCPGGHSKSSTQVDSARAPTPYPFMYHLWTEKVLSRIPYIDKFVPFHRPTIRDKSS